MAAQHSDALLCLDELAQLDPRVAGESCLHAGQRARQESRRPHGRRTAAPDWRLLFLSAGEIGLAEHMSEANKRTRAGQELRMIDLPADAGAGLGIFEHVARARERRRDWRNTWHAPPKPPTARPAAPGSNT